ncbi:MAG TPA: hypothetical protein VNK70_02235 [Candidatus Paceibacterota bacterium]|nr:hypothetical protein [Candidatus Paceibacterota bacterium]
MNFALIYVLERFFYRIYRFLDHWYVRSVKIYSNFILDLLGRVDYYLAWKITLRHLFEPLYKDYSVLGYVLGFVFRISRLVGAGICYLIIFIFAIAAYLTWLLFIPYAVYKIFT